MASVQDLQHVVMLYLATILIFVGIFTSAWTVNWRVTNLDIKSGLFKHCVYDHCVDQEGTNKAVKGLEIVGALAAVICCICMTVHQAITDKSSSAVKTLPPITFYMSIAGGLVFLGCAIFAFEKYGESIYPGYSFVLVLIGGVILIIGGAASSKK